MLLKDIFDASFTYYSQQFSLILVMILISFAGYVFNNGFMFPCIICSILEWEELLFYPITKMELSKIFCIWLAVLLVDCFC